MRLAIRRAAGPVRVPSSLAPAAAVLIHKLRISTRRTLIFFKNIEARRRRAEPYRDKQVTNLRVVLGIDPADIQVAPEEAN
jgi:hypothetical protein